jgi:RNA polymerase sigma factor (sigma-70 family)
MGKPGSLPTAARPGDSTAPRPTRDLAGWEDGALVAEYAATRDAAVFAQIAGRYGAMVFRTCYRRLGNLHDAEDATQAVFLLLARRPLRARESLAGWLHRAARDTAITLLRARTRRARREEAAAIPETAPAPTEPNGLREEIDNGIARLPTRLREAVILCYLEGRRQEEAARVLGCSQGTLSRWAADALERLRSVLVHRGVVVTSAVLAAYLAGQQAAVAAPPGLLASLAVTGTGGLAVSASAGALADATARAALLAKVKLTAGVVLSAVVVVGGTALALKSSPTPVRESVTLANFDGPMPPVNQAGDGYPRPGYDPAHPDQGGLFTASIEPTDAVAGRSLRMRVTKGRLSAMFTPEGPPGIKSFTRNYVVNPSAWRFNTFNRLRFWVKCPPASPPHGTTGHESNMSVGTYVKRVRDANPQSLDVGGGYYFHRINVPALNCWTQVILNMHPQKATEDRRIQDPGNLPHPTGEKEYNYFDALTQFYIEVRWPPKVYPADYLLDEMEFYHEPYAENDDQVYGLTGTHEPKSNRLIFTWNRRMEENTVAHEVRYAFADIHVSGWEKAKPAPGGTVRPPARGDTANSMVYDSSELPLAGQRMVWIAVKPQNSERFSQIAVPLSLK